MSQLIIDTNELAYYEERVNTLIEYYFSLSKQKQSVCEKQKLLILKQMHSVDTEFKEILVKFAS